MKQEIDVFRLRKSACSPHIKSGIYVAEQSQHKHKLLRKSLQDSETKLRASWHLALLELHNGPLTRFLSWKFHFVFPSSWGIFRLSSTTNSMSTAGRAQSFIVLHCWNNRHGDSHVSQSMCSRPTVRSLASSNNIFGYFLIRTKEESEEMKIIFIQISNFCMTQQSVVERKWAELPANTRAIYIESNASKCMRMKRVGLSIVKYKKEHEKDETQHWQ